MRHLDSGFLSITHLVADERHVRHLIGVREDLSYELHLATKRMSLDSQRPGKPRAFQRGAREERAHPVLGVLKRLVICDVVADEYCL